MILASSSLYLWEERKKQLHFSLWGSEVDKPPASC